MPDPSVILPTSPVLVHPAGKLPFSLELGRPVSARLAFGTLVSLLLFRCSPPAILGGIGAVVVDAFDLQPLLESGFHVLKECEESWSPLMATPPP